MSFGNSEDPVGNKEKCDILSQVTLQSRSLLCAVNIVSVYFSHYIE